MISLLVAAALAYANPTPGAELALQIGGMHRAQVTRHLVYRRVGRERLRMDVYRPRGARRDTRLPVVVLGGPSGYRAGKDTGQKVGWAQAAAASGLAAVAFDTRTDGRLTTPLQPSTDVAYALAYVRRNAARLGLDATRMCTLGFSLGTAPWHLWAALRGPAAGVRCNVVFYGPLDFEDIYAELPKEFWASEHLRRHGAKLPPMFVAKAGRESYAGINESIDRFAELADEVGADVTVVTHATGAHAFDIYQHDARSRSIIREALAFLRDRLGRSATG